MVEIATSTAAVFSMSALALIMIIITVYFAIFFLIFWLISWGILQVFKPILQIMRHAGNPHD